MNCEVCNNPIGVSFTVRQVTYAFCTTCREWKIISEDELGNTQVRPIQVESTSEDDHIKYPF